MRRDSAPRPSRAGAAEEDPPGDSDGRKAQSEEPDEARGSPRLVQRHREGAENSGAHHAHHGERGAAPGVQYGLRERPRDDAAGGEAAESGNQDRAEVLRRLAAVRSVGEEGEAQDGAPRRGSDDGAAQRGAELVAAGLRGDAGLAQMWMTRPSESSAASPTASERVGCAWIANSISSTVNSFARATTSSWIISVACSPAM